MSTWKDVVGLASRLVLHPPPALMRRIARTTDLVVLVVPFGVADQRWVVELADQIVAGGSYIEVESPIDVMVMNVADARATHCGKAEAWAYGTVGVQLPEAYVAIPSGFHFTHQHHLPTLHINGHAEVVASVRS